MQNETVRVQLDDARSLVSATLEHLVHCQQGLNFFVRVCTMHLYFDYQRFPDLTLILAFCVNYLIDHSILAHVYKLTNFVPILKNGSFEITNNDCGVLDVAWLEQRERSFCFASFGVGVCSRFLKHLYLPYFLQNILVFL